MNSCVVKNRDFYSLAEEHGIDGNELELIVHKYWNEVGKEDSFPPSSYINEQLGIGKKYEESGKAVRQLWEKVYSKPIKYKSQMELSSAVEEAKKYFPAEAIVTYKDNNGNYVLRVIEPYNGALAKEAVEREMKGIKQKAQDDGTFMKAPNGKDTKLTERQWLQVRTKAFKDWFGDWENNPKEASKVVDENGEPLVVYHESPETFETFDTSKKRYNVHDAQGIWASSVDRKGRGYGENVYPLFLNLRNPASTSTKQVLTITELRALENKALKKPNADGAILETIDKFGFETQYYVKNPNQSKSAAGNNGNFSTTDNNIYHERENTSHAFQTSDALKTLFDKGEATIKDLVNIVNNSEYKDVISALKAISGGKNKLLGDVKVKLVSPLGQYSKAEEARKPFEGRRAYYDAQTKTIVINVDSGFAGGDPSSVITHEIMHHVTVSRILGNPELKAKFYDIIQQYREHYPSEYREMSDIHFIEEFIADLWSNKSTIEKAKKIKYKGEGYKGSLWDRIKQFFKNELFKGGVENSLFVQASELMVELIESNPTSDSAAYNNSHYPTKTKSRQEMGGRLGYSNSQGVTISEDITVKDFFDYIQGKVAGTTSKQQKAVFERLAKKGYTAAFLRKIVRTNEDAARLIRYHEYSHLYHNDREGYYEGDPIDSNGKRSVNWLSEHKLQIEERATIDAINRLLSEKELDRTFIEGMQDSAASDSRIPDRNPEGPLKDFTLHSGGALGADFAWAEIGASYGVEGKHYYDATDAREGKKPPYANTPITDAERTEGADKALYAGKVMGRLEAKAQKVSDPLIIRDWMQIKNSSMVVTIAQKFDNTGDRFSNNPSDSRTALIPQVSGGTGWAVQMAISEGIPVYVFNQSNGKWYVNFCGQWKHSEAPILKENFTGIGTRNINDAGRAAIKECYEKTVEDLNKPTPTVEETAESKKPFNRNSLSPEMQAEFDRLTRRSTQINNILSSEVITSTEAREIVDDLMCLVSDYITEVMNDPALLNGTLKARDSEAYLKSLLVNKNFEGAITPFNPSGLTRREVINKIGIDNLMNIFIKSKLTPNGNMTRKQIKKMQVLASNLDAILYLGANTLSINEGIHLTTTRVNGHEVKSMDDGIVINSDLNSARDAESVQENEGSLQEKWQIDSRTEDVLESMSQIVRNTLFQMYQLDSNGNKIISSMGINKRLPVQETTKQLLSWLQGSLTLTDMVAKLKTKESSNPWVKQLIAKLENTDGTYTDFQNSFFSVFNKHFQSYSATIVTYDSDGTQHIKRVPLNDKPFVKATISHMQADIAVGIHPMFKPNGIDKQAFASLTAVRDTLHKIKDDKISRYGFNKLNAQDKALALEAVSQAASLLGYPVDKNTLDSLLTGKDIVKMITYLDNMYDNILANVNNPNYDPLSYNKEDNEQKSGGIRGSMTKFLEPLTRHLQDITVNTVFDNGKMYQSHVTPSYMTKLALKFHEEDQAKFDEFIQNEFGQYDWFKGPSGWRSGWLSRLVKDPEARKVFKHEAKLNYNKHNYMKNMTGNEYILSLLSSFFSEGAGKGKKDAKAWYRIPILSNKPSEEYIRFYAEMGADFKDAIADKMLEVFNQELSRIQTVRMQNYDKSDPRFIKNFHTNGKRFCFLDFLNVYLEDSNSELGKLMQEKLESSNWDSSKEVELMSLAKQAIKDAMEAKVQSIIENYERRGILEAAKSIEGINDGFGKDNIKENIERFLWNDSYAATQIMELTVTDIAYYKDMEDLQKRIAQIHSPGVRGNVEAVDYTGARVSDGYERTMYLTDFAGVVSNIKSNVKIVFDRKLEELKAKPLDDFLGRKPETEEDLAKAEEIKDSRIAAQKALYESILKQYDDINVADAQGYSSPTSYRKKMFIFGKWSKEAESVYQKLISGEFNYADLKVAFQPLKPFVYSQIPKSTGLDAGPMRNIKMPVQNKNSEYLLILADAILQNEDTGQPNLLRAIYEVMEESAKVSPTKGIDTIQFESTVKSGLMGRNDINRVLSEEGNWRELVETTVNGKTVKRTRGEIAAKAFLQSHLYSKNAEGNVTGYNSIYVHELPFEDYCIQQEVPIHFKEHEQQHGSQIRMIIPSDLATVDSFGNKVTYEVEGRQLKAEEFRAEYEKTIARNIEESINELSKELHLDAANNVEKNIVISRMLQDEILSSPRYGLDMYLACSLDPTTGEFRIPLGDPIQANRIEQLLNSIIKKRVNEQKLPGGPVVQVSNFGTSRKLNIRFKDKTKEGALLMTREEFEKTWKPETPMENNKQNLVKLANQLMKEEKLSYSVALKEAQNRLSNPSKAKTVDEAYTEYIKTNQGGIDHFEVFAPIFSDEIFDRFADADGNIDIKAMQEVCPEALQMIGYRIPTEDKYSCAPIKIVGFLPREAGEGIMLPYDITLLTGSDFDVDKEYLMRKQVNIGLKSFKEQYDLLSPYFLELKKKESGLKRDFTKEELANYKAELTDMIDMFRSNSSRRNYRKEAGTSTIEKQMWDKFKRVGYNITKASEGRTYRNNKIFDMSWTVLTHETTSDKILNPGGFEEQKRDAYMMEAYKNSDKSWEELQTMGTDELKALSYNTKNLIFSDSQVQFYEQNNAASTILGMFAVQKIAHATLESNGYKIDVQEVCGLSEPFTILGMTFEGQMEIDKMYDKEGNVIGKTLGSHVAAAADAAKEPCLNLLNINSQTANVHSTLIRLGMPFKDAALFLGQPVIREILDTYNKKNIDDYASLDSVISDYLKDFIENGSMYDSKIEHEDITREELIHNVKERRPETDYKIVRAFSRLQQIADALKGPTYITRFNSISNAVGPLITDNMVTEYKTQFSSIGLYTKEGNALDADKILQDHPVLRLFNAAYAKANEIFADFPSCSEAFRNVLQEAPFILQDKFYKDREMLNDLKDFFLSHLLIDKNVVNEAKAKYYIKDYAKEFATNNIKAKYPDNEFIQAINIKIDSDTKEYTLELSTTGMDQAKKDRLSSFWFELYKQNSKLALDLFNYNFFRGGIGFTPKTFMNLLPLQIREIIPGYKECFADMSSYSYTSKYILEQYLAHNTSNNKLFPTKECKKEITGGGIIISGSETADYTNVATFKFQDAKKKWRYMMLEKIGDDGFVYKEILPLGDNGSYLEMSSLSMPQVSLKEIYGTKKKSKQLEPKQSEVTTQSNQPVEDTSTGQTYKTPGEEKSYAEALIKGMIQEYPGITDKEAAKNTLLGMKNAVVDIHNSVVQKYIKAAVESQGLKYDENKLQEELDKLC